MAIPAHDVYCVLARYAYQQPPSSLPADLVEYVSEVAAGIPLQIDETVKALVDQKARMHACMHI